MIGEFLCVSYMLHISWIFFPSVDGLSFSRAPSFRTQTFAYPESTAEREEILQGLDTRIEDIKSVSLVNEYNQLPLLFDAFYLKIPDATAGVWLL